MIHETCGTNIERTAYAGGQQGDGAVGTDIEIPGDSGGAEPKIVDVDEERIDRLHHLHATEIVGILIQIDVPGGIERGVAGDQEGRAVRHVATRGEREITGNVESCELDGVDIGERHIVAGTHRHRAEVVTRTPEDDVASGVEARQRRHRNIGCRGDVAGSGHVETAAHARVLKHNGARVHQRHAADIRQHHHIEIVGGIIEGNVGPARTDRQRACDVDCTDIGKISLQRQTRITSDLNNAERKIAVLDDGQVRRLHHR